ncbi:hypothetical protein FHW79_004727 [Azospirillum sp. OGB3]|uniref:hypothetical protein n=1 Tax=Azospirillum sp. OGB3 TaxID=2587012 RepID=UPI00160646E1|nr:hypothetical protein [Azospirillum sp. OGB3]MBB3267075.1 hypothetical protein [Azospirillum sp. OGB3]
MAEEKTPDTPPNAGPGKDSPLEDKSKTPGDGTLQDAVPAGTTSDELRRRAEEDDGSVQPGTG